MAVVSTTNTQSVGDAPSTTNYSAMAMVTTLFFIWGFTTVLNDALIPHLQSVFSLNYVEALLIQLAFFGSYFLFAQPASKLIERFGYQRSMVIGLITMAAGALLFLPAAATAAYGLFLAAQVVLGAGVTILQVAANPYVTILGPPETASSRLNLTQAFNTIGDVFAPFLGSMAILGGATEGVLRSKKLQGAALQASLVQQAASVKLPYALLAGVLIILALAIAFYKFPRLEVTRDFRSGELGGKRDSIWNHPHLYLGALAIFIYVGAEVSLGSIMGKFLSDSSITGLPLAQAVKLVSLYWACMAVGRFVGSALMQRMSPSNLLILCGIGAGIMVLCALLGTGHFAAITIIGVGLFNSIMFPTIFTLGVADLGTLTGRGSGLLVQGIVGGAAIPVLMGFLADRIGIHRSLFLPFLCYLFIIYYGWRGYRIKSNEPIEHIQAV